MAAGPIAERNQGTTKLLLIIIHYTVRGSWDDSDNSVQYWEFLNCSVELETGAFNMKQYSCLSET